jgi:hypothetical protein
MVTHSSGFTAWLKDHANEKGFLGSLARSVMSDPNWPAEADIATYHQYLLERGAPTELQTVLSKAWYEYRMTQTG